jgi:hypothetical protein
MSDDPIEPLGKNQRHIAEIIDLAGVRVQWGLSKTPKVNRCMHKNLTYSSAERRVWCQDCKKTIDNFDAFFVIVQGFQKMEASVRQKMEKAEAAMKSSLRRRASKAIDDAWSSATPAICCPHCKGGLLPEDFENIPAKTSREYEIARRRKKSSNQRPQ